MNIYCKSLLTIEWIISIYNSGEMDGSMLMREQSVNKYPDNLTSEYDWNN